MNKIKHVYDKHDKEYTDVAYFQVKFRDVFNMKDLYEYMHDWLVEEKWAGDDAKFPETFYLKREDQVMGEEQWIRWRFEKYPEGTKSWRADMYVQFHILGMKDIEVLVNGQKEKTNSGEVEIKIWMKLIPVFSGLRKTPVLKHLFHIFLKRVLYHEKEKWRNHFYREAYRFQEMIKTYLRLPTYLPEPEMQRFHPTR